MSEERVKSCIEALRGTTGDVSSDELRRLTNYALEGYGTAQNITHPDLMVYRARKYSKDEPFPNVLDFWGPQASQVTGRGRFNEAGDSRLYCASDFATVLYEVEPEPGDYISLLVAAKTEPERPVKLVPLGILRIAHLAELGLSANQPFNAEIDAQLRETGCLNRWQLQDDYLADITTAYYQDKKLEQHAYAKTIAVARKFDNYPETSGLMYPSVARQRHGINLCLPGSIADSIFFPFEAWHIHVGERPWGLPENDGRPQGIMIEVQRVSKSIGDDGAIDWCERSHFPRFAPDYAYERLKDARGSKNPGISFGQLRQRAGRPLDG